MSDQHLFCHFQYRDCLLVAYARKMVQENVQGVPILNIIEQGLNRYPGPHEDGSSTQGLRIAMDQRVPGLH